MRSCVLYSIIINTIIYICSDGDGGVFIAFEDVIVYIELQNGQ